MCQYPFILIEEPAQPFGDYISIYCVISMNENFQGNFSRIKLAAAVPNMVTFRGFF